MILQLFLAFDPIIDDSSQSVQKIPISYISIARSCELFHRADKKTSAPKERLHDG